MYTFFEVMKGFFFFATICVGIIFLRGELIRWVEDYAMVKSLIIPGYLVFCGIIIGYIIAHMTNVHARPEHENRTYVVAFIIWISIGIILALSYILL